MALVVPAWAKAMEAKVVIIENVPPFLESDYWREMTNELISDGYNIDTWVLNAAEHNTPQIRKRAFTIASKIGLPDMPSKRKEVPARKIFAKDISESDSLHVWPIHEGDSYQRILNVPYCGSKTDLMKSNPELCPESWFKMGKQATDVWGRINPDKPINTIRCSFQSPSKGRYLHPSENRVISLREGARFQGIPDSWQFVGSRTSIARQIGNGVPVPLARAIAKQVKSLFEAV
jgi:DNA (cytosine-5)-methyltransferase 1